MRTILNILCLSLALVAFRAHAQDVACLTSIAGESTFQMCSKLSSIVLPTSLVSVRGAALSCSAAP